MVNSFNEFRGEIALMFDGKVILFDCVPINIIIRETDIVSNKNNKGIFHTSLLENHDPNIILQEHDTIDHVKRMTRKHNDTKTTE